MYKNDSLSIEELARMFSKLLKERGELHRSEIMTELRISQSRFTNVASAADYHGVMLYEDADSMFGLQE